MEDACDKRAGTSSREGMPCSRFGTRRIRFAWKGEAFDLEWKQGDTVRSLFDGLEPRVGCERSTLKLLQGNVALTTSDEEKMLIDSGLVLTKKVMVLASTKEDLFVVRDAKEERWRSEEEEDVILRNRSRIDPTYPSIPTNKEARFHGFQVLEIPPGFPSKGDAMNLLKRLASDPGVIGVMKHRRWKVGLLSEMPPEGKVGISERCVLGYNRNRGEEISLRLRTDDLLGFRKYLKIRETLLHELAHMEHDEHDREFKALNSRLNVECKELDWKHSTGRKLVGDAFPGGDRERFVLHQDARPARLGGSNKASKSPQEAAAQAALERAEQKKT